MSRKIDPVNETEWVTAMFSKPQEKPPGWFTIAELIKLTGISDSRMREKVRKQVAEGTLEKMSCMVGGKLSNCYRPKK